MRAALYARVSSEAQDTDDKTSLQEQMADMKAYCERRGLTITARYQEVGRGWSKNRPEFQRLLVDARAGRFDTIVREHDLVSAGHRPRQADDAPHLPTGRDRPLAPLRHAVVSAGKLSITR